MPRKSDIAPDSKEANTSPPGKDKDKDIGISIDDHTLPKSIVTRLAKGVLPQNTNVQKDAVLALSKGGTVFINYLCATANDQAKQHGRKTINPKDVLDAMELLEFGDFLPRLEAELAKFNEIAEGKRANNPRKPKDKASVAATKDSPDTGDGDSPPAAKKMRVGSGLKSAAAGGKGEGEDEEESGDDEGEDDEDDDVPDDVPDDDDATESDAEEEEPEEVLDAEAEAEPEENGDREEDEALDNGLDSD